MNEPTIAAARMTEGFQLPRNNSFVGNHILPELSDAHACSQLAGRKFMLRRSVGRQRAVSAPDENFQPALGELSALPECAPRLLARPARLPQRIAVFVAPNFSMMGFTAVIEAQRIANYMSGRGLYSWHVLSKDGQPVLASNGVVVTGEASLSDAGRYDQLHR